MVLGDQDSYMQKKKKKKRKRKERKLYHQLTHIKKRKKKEFYYLESWSTCSENTKDYSNKLLEIS